MKNALDQIRHKSREKLEIIERLTEESIILKQNEPKLAGKEHSAKRHAIIYVISEMESFKEVDKKIIQEELEVLDRDMWSILMAKAQGEALEKLEGCNQGEGLWAYLRIHLWFTKTTAQGKSVRRSAIMTPTRCKHEHEISAAIER